MANNQVVEQEEEGQQQDEQQQAEITTQDEADESAAFAASFGEARSDELPAEEQDNANEDESGVEGNPEGEEQAQAQTETDGQPNILIAGLTEEQLAERLEKITQIEQTSQAEMRKLYGKIGEFNRTLESLKGGEGGQAKLNLAKVQFKRLQEEYPEVAELLGEDLSGIDFSGSGVSDDQINEIVEKRVAESVTTVRNDVAKEMGLNLLQIQHGRNFQSLLYEQETVTENGKTYVRPKKDANGDFVRQPEFAAWLKTQPEEEQTNIENAWDPVYLSEKLTEFKDWRGKKTQGTQQRQERLRNAITPKTTQVAQRTAAMTEEDGFNASFAKK